MKSNHPLFLAFLLLCTLSVAAQKKELPLFLNDGVHKSSYTITPARIDSFNHHASRFKGKTIAVLQFQTLPSEETKRQMALQGIELLEYIPRYAYTASISGFLNPGLLQKCGIQTITSLTAKQKMHPALATGTPPSAANKTAGMQDVQVTFPKTFLYADVAEALKGAGATLLSTAFGAYRVLTIRIPADQLNTIAALPFVTYMQPAFSKDQPLNFNSRLSTQASLLNTALADGGRGLNGEGIVMGIGDNADVQFHADFTGRLINRTTSTAQNHGTHVHGTAAGAGIVYEQYRGFAPKATIVSQDFSNILAYAPVYVHDYGMVITNNSYGIVAGCSTKGTYDIYSYIMDQQAFDMPSLQHVFAAGNSGSNTCTPYPAGFHTVLGGYQSAKNTLSVGDADYFGNISYNSSKGPVADGRIKPEITAMGTAVYSCFAGNNYGTNWGTSMASPAVAGGLALLYQRYRQLNGNVNPENGLMKALLCNGATDKGQPGPDYSNGFGYMNLERSITMLENKQYVIDNSSNGVVKSHTITVPANTAQLKVMLYWNDPAQSLVTSQALVNDLDLKVINPAAVATFPKVLNLAPEFVTTVAVEGVDHINNMEQVVIDNPAAGNYTLQVQGSIAQNPSQEYFVVYDFIPAGLKLNYPAAGAVLVPGAQANITWEWYGSGSTTFNLEYSTDNGSHWSTIAAGISATARNYFWAIPAETTSTAIIRIKENGTAANYTSAPFTIIGTPAVSLAATQCEGYMNLTWTAVAGAADYEIMLLRGTEMVPVTTTTETAYAISGLSKDSIYWAGVRARINGKPGWRSISVSRQPNSGTCSGAISDNDLKLNAIIAPVSGRKFTSTELQTTAVKVEVKNLDDAPVTGFTVQYQINGGTWVFENVATSVEPGAVYTHTFSTIEDFSATGLYNITAVVKNVVTDGVSNNDTLTQSITHLENQPITLSTPFLDDMEGASDAIYTSQTRGVTGAERYDFTPGAFGRLRTFVNSGVAISGNKALLVDVDRQLSATPYPVQYLVGTYNLSAYQIATNDLRLQFNSINGCDVASADNKVWIRGNDAQSWIEAYGAVPYGTTASIDLTNLLRTNGQDFSSSFQIRWGVPSSGPIASQDISKGLQLDDVQLGEVFDDVQLLSIVRPTILTCGLSSAVPVTIALRNSSSHALANVTVRYRINNGAWISETISSIPANISGQYTFATKANFSLAGTYGIAAEVVYSTDTYTENNSAQVTIFNSASITTFPYLQNFESSDGGWYADGNLSSWQYGTPASPKIGRAASGTKAWKTKLDGNYNNQELSYLYSPCFNIAGMTKPAISFSVALDLENCGSALCDGAWVEYSIDNTNWYNLADFSGSGTNWYSAPLYAWSIENYTSWHVATMKLPTGYSRIRFRFVMRSDDNVTREGMAIDDVHVYDNTKGIYTGASLAAPVTQTVSGNNWIHFESDGKLIASVLPNNQDLGTTSVEAFINTGAVRYTADKQYYHDRNITIKPSIRTLAAPATVRFYFLESETKALIEASNCTGCSKPATVFDLGISKFSAANTSYENGTISDNTNTGTWLFLTPDNVKKVPFDKGYYAEFQVQDFSEFWLNNGGFNNNTVLPVRIIQFTAKRAGAAVALNWTTADERNVNRYEIELARTNDEWQQGRFQTIGTVKSNTSKQGQSYTFPDEEASKTGIRYYRLKIIDADGTIRYSEVRSVFFSDAVSWQVSPNPSTGVFYITYQAAAGEKVHMQIEDATGRILQKLAPDATGFLQKTSIDLTGQPAGVYLLHVQHQDKVQYFKLYKQ